jgi:glycosyltransferase involved in cell wall biosynthesis
MARPAITTVIPTFRRPRLLKRAIESVLSQSVDGLKVCIYDNASGDETEEVVAQYARQDPRVYYFKNAENIGSMNNFTQAIEAVTTDYYSILSDDDFLLPGFYQNALRAFETHSSAVFVCARTMMVNLLTRKLHLRNRDWRPGFYPASPESASRMYASHFALTGVVLRTVVRDCLGALEKSGDDCLYLSLAAASFPFAVLDYYGAVFTFYPQSYSATTGLRGGESSVVFAALLNTIGTILKLNLGSAEKVHLLLLVIRSYQYSFDMKKLEHFVGVPAEDRSSVLTLRSTVTLTAILARLCERAPRVFHPLLRYYARRVTRRWKITESNRTESEAPTIPSSIVNLLLDGNTDLQPLFAFAATVAGELGREDIVEQYCVGIREGDRKDRRPPPPAAT